MRVEDTAVAARSATVAERREALITKTAKELLAAFAAGSFRVDVRFPADWHADAAADATRAALECSGLGVDIAQISEVRELRRSVVATILLRFTHA